MAEPELNEAAKAELEAGKAARAESMKVFGERTKGKPTPTQEENDEAALGKHFMEHEPDGAELDPDQINKRLESKPGGGYTTRQTQATQTRATPTPPKT